ncbi:shikimate kinase [Elstera cyanobacteriorum]|uniref:shikimate kinase n=1 Tax=Elstera cyanobacteriorum TaxID=2022747 RepID=UPI0023537343|nr:shikimate kinase [Elstera cyanobacteriorum]MCK6441317.1 shikimate kinase [Elstera cyanobacteriorum]
MARSTDPDSASARQGRFVPARTVVLVGLMGSGKSSVGRRLAQRLALPFRDADIEIEQAAGQTIPEIFATHGEAHFRDGERRVIARLLEEPVHVLATGGGAFMDARTREAITARGISIWLRVDLDELVRRTARRNHRPLLNQGDPRQILAGLMEQRYPVYADADITVDGGAGDVEEMTERVLKALTAYCQSQFPAPSE